MTALSSPGVDAAGVSTPGEARARVDRIKVGVEVVWGLIVESYQARDWLALGYSTWDDMCTREFGTSRLRLPREERAETVQSLRDSGLSLRAIASATGESKDTVARTLAPVADETPARVIGPIEVGVDQQTGEVIHARDITEALTDVAGPGPITTAEHHPTVVPPRITGLDGKSYNTATPTRANPPIVDAAPRRKPLTDAAVAAGFDLRKSVERIERIVSDDRYRTNEKQVANALRGHLLYVAETVAAVLDQLP